MAVDVQPGMEIKHPGGTVPLVRYLTLACVAQNRADAKKLIGSGQVSVDGKVITGPHALSVPVLEGVSTVVCAGIQVAAPGPHRHVLLNKPAGVLTHAGTVCQDDGSYVPDTRPHAETLLDQASRQRHCRPVGRLDLDTTGVLLFTSDGVLANRLLRPGLSHAKKRYRAVLRDASPLSEEAIARLDAGVVLPGPKRRMVSGKACNCVDDGIFKEEKRAVVELEITEGARHQVKHMLGIVGRPLARLHRTEFAGIVLGAPSPVDCTRAGAGASASATAAVDGTHPSFASPLPLGACRDLTAAEVMHLYAIAERVAEEQRRLNLPQHGKFSFRQAPGDTGQDSGQDTGQDTGQAQDTRDAGKGNADDDISTPSDTQRSQQ